MVCSEYDIKFKKNNFNKNLLFFFLVAYDPKFGLSFRVYYFRFGGGQVGLVTNRVTFMPQILGILQTRMRKFINNYFCYTSNLHNVQEEGQ